MFHCSAFFFSDRFYNGDNYSALIQLHYIEILYGTEYISRQGLSFILFYLVLYVPRCQLYTVNLRSVTRSGVIATTKAAFCFYIVARQLTLGEGADVIASLHFLCFSVYVIHAVSLYNVN